MNSTQLTRRSAALLLLASLAACGGSDDSDEGSGNGNGNGTDNGNGNGNGNGNTTTPVTGQYRLESPSASFTAALATANQLGAMGYAFISTLGAGTATGVSMGDFYVTDTTHAKSRLDYVADAETSNLAGFLAQLNQRGAQGYLYKSTAAFMASQKDVRNIYVRDSTLGRTYTYEAVESDMNAATAKLIGDQLASQGARGFRWLGPMILGSQSFNLYCKDSVSTTYEYTLSTPSGGYSESNAAELKKSLDAMGAQGRMTRGALALSTGTAVAVWEKSSAQQGAIQYLVESGIGNDTLAQMKSRMDANAAKSFFYFSGMVTADGAMHNISVANANRLLHPLAGAAFP